MANVWGKMVSPGGGGINLYKMMKTSDKKCPLNVKIFKNSRVSKYRIY